jgi:hypothetical protein
MPAKGQILSVEAIEKMKQSKLSRLLSKYNWVLAEPYLDVEIKNGCGKRVNEYIVFRKFKEHILSGLSINDMVSMGISRKVLQFFSNFCQGKIGLTKEQFEYNYHQGLSLEEICYEYSVTREDLTYLRQLYGIKRKGATFINRKNTEISLTQRQKDILYGSMMGDAKRQSNRWNSIAGFGQSGRQKDYLLWKFEEFKSIVNEKTLKFRPSVDDREEYKNSSGTWSFYTKANSDIEECMNKFYKEDGKQIDRDILNNLSELSLAVWFMDDGTTDYSHNKMIKTGHNIIPSASFCTDSFSKQSCDNIVEWFKERWNIDAHLRKRQRRKDGGMSYRVIIDSTSVDDFLSLVRPHIIPSMLYKVDYDEYKKKK